MEKRSLVTVCLTVLLGTSYSTMSEAAAPCPTNPGKFRRAITCINDRLDALEGIDRTTEPVYQDDVVRISAKASRRRTDNPELFQAVVALRIRNITSAPLLLKQANGFQIKITDENGSGCNTLLESFPLGGREDFPATYLTLKPGKSVSTNVRDITCLRQFTGATLDISLDLLRYDAETNGSAPFTATLTGVAAPLP